MRNRKATTRKREEEEEEDDDEEEEEKEEVPSMVATLYVAQIRGHAKEVSV